MSGGFLSSSSDLIHPWLSEDEEWNSLETDDKNAGQWLSRRQGSTGDSRPRLLGGLWRLKNECASLLTIWKKKRN